MGFAKDVSILKNQKITLETLKELYNKCDECNNMFKYFGAWSNKEYSPFMIIGQNPSYSTKDNFNKKFEKIYFQDSRNEKLLKKSFNHVGLDFNKFYITNLCKCASKDNIPINISCSLNCFREFLFNELRIIKPKIIFILGGLTYDHFTDILKELKIKEAFIDLKEIENTKKFLLDRKIGILKLPHPSARFSVEKRMYNILRRYNDLFRVIERERKFNHLHVHNCHSIGDSLIKINEQAEFLASSHKKQIVTTNHGRLTDTLQIMSEAKKYNLKPVIGCELYCMKHIEKLEKIDDAKKKRMFRKENERHIVLIAKNKKGLNNLIRIHNSGWIKGFYYKPYVSIDDILKHSDDLIALTACTKGLISNEILKGDIKEAEVITGKLKKAFGDNLYIEIPLINFDEQIKISDELIKISDRFNIKTVVTNDVHYLKKEDAKMRSFLYKMKYGENFGNDMLEDLNFKSYLEMRDYWKRFYKTKIFTNKVFEESVNNVINILEEVEYINLSDSHRISIYKNSKEIFLKKLKNALYKKAKDDKFDSKKLKIYKDRLIKEIKVIGSKELIDYFLIINDIINFTKEKYGNEFVGPGRGSAAGSLVNYLLNITSIDPIKHNLLFERFLSEDRDDLVDIDVDFATSVRDDVLKYIEKKYGEDHVLHIGTHSYLKLRNTIQDVSRYFKIPSNETYTLTTKLYDINEADSLEKLRDENKILDDYLNKYSKHKLEKYIDSIRDTIRQYSAHAAGVVISNEDLYNTVPVVKTSKAIVSGWQDGSNYRELTEIGYYKYDILGLNNLSVIADTLELIRERHGKDINLEKLNLKDKKTYDFIKTDDYMGIFQFESVLASRVINLIKPNTFEDYVATNALLRPGPLRAGMVEIYARRKNKIEEYKVHESLKEILDRTYGIIIEQEQIMQICNKLGGFNYNEANKFRKALVKYTKSFETELKRIKEAASYQEKFIKNAKEYLGEDKAKEIFELILKFVAYGFNRSHAVSYAMISYYEMYLKANYLLEFYTSLLNNVHQGSKNKYFDYDVKEYIISAVNHNIKILPPDINKSLANFNIEGKNIRYGLLFIKNISNKVCEEIIKKRPYKSFKDFFEKADKFYLNKGKVKSLIFSGAFDKLGDREKILKEYYKLRKEDDKEINNINLRSNEIDSLRLRLSSLNDFKLIRRGIFNKYKKISDKMFDVYRIGNIINRSRYALISLYNDRKMYRSVFVSSRIMKNLRKNKVIIANVLEDQKGYSLQDYRIINKSGEISR